MRSDWRCTLTLFAMLGLVPSGCGGATSDSPAEEEDEADDDEDTASEDDPSDDFKPRPGDDDDDSPVVNPPKPSPDAGAPPTMKMDAAMPSKPPVFNPCPQPYEFEMDLQGATAENATLVHHTADNSCGKGSMEVKLALMAGQKAVITLPVKEGTVDLQNKLLWCKYKRGATDSPDVKVWLQAFSDSAKWIEAWELHPLGKWSPVRKKEVDYALKTSKLVLWLDLVPKDATYTGSIFLDECGWE